MQHSKLRVLVVEDDPVQVRLVRRWLLGWSMEMTAAGTLAEGLKCLADNFDALIVDIQLPDGSAEALVRQALLARPVPRIVVVTGLATRFEAFKFGQMGASSFIEKPLVQQDLRAALSATLPLLPLHAQAAGAVGQEGWMETGAAVKEIMLAHAMGMSQGNVSAAARMLGVSRQAVQHAIKRRK